MVAYPKIVVSPPGPKARELVRKDEQFVSPSYTGITLLLLTQQMTA